VTTKTNTSLSNVDVRTRVKELRSSDLYMTMSEIGKKVNIPAARFSNIESRRAPHKASNQEIFVRMSCVRYNKRLQILQQRV